MKVLLRKHKETGDIEFAPVYFNSTTKTLIILNVILITLFKKFCLIDNWINEGFGWVSESMDGQYVKIFIYSPLSGNSHIKLPVELRN